jgi:hypothetical protein
MTIQLTHKEIKEARRLGKCLDNGIVPVDDVKKLLQGIQRQIDNPAAGPARKINGAKVNRKAKYRSKLFTS